MFTLQPTGLRGPPGPSVSGLKERPLYKFNVNASFQGEAGATGNTGAQGPDGPIGKVGNPGEKGITLLVKLSKLN